jgi:hypothetical protein
VLLDTEMGTYCPSAVLDPDTVELVLNSLLPDHIHLLVRWELEDVLEIRRGCVRRAEDLILPVRTLRQLLQQWTRVVLLTT